MTFKKREEAVGMNDELKIAAVQMEPKILDRCSQRKICPIP